MRRRAVALAFAVAASGAATGQPGVAAVSHTPTVVRGPDCRGSDSTEIDALQLLELQISYTTLMARYYKPVDPKLLVRGAHGAVEALLKRCGIVDARRSMTKPNQDGSEAIDTDFLTVLTSYGRLVNAGSLVDDIIAGELSEMHDPYTVLFRPEGLKSFNTFLQGEKFGGVGIALDARASRPRVTEVIPQSPADDAGIESGDVIASVDGVDTTGKPPDRLRDLLRGKIGTVARIAVDRDGKTMSFAVTRAEIRDPQTLYHTIGTDVGYIQLTRFGDGATAEVAGELAKLQERGATSFVLDLRNNGGGYGDAAVGITSLFVSSGIVYSTRERTGPQSSETVRPGTVFHGPLVVLVNHDTASASEIVAGALQDDRAATIVGTQSYGKGVVQSVFPLPDKGAIKMTTARYFTPNGRSIDHVGITPDVVVTEPADSHLGDPDRDPQLARAIAIVRAAAPSAPAPVGSPPVVASPPAAVPAATPSP